MSTNNHRADFKSYRLAAGDGSGHDALYGSQLMSYDEWLTTFLAAADEDRPSNYNELRGR